MAYQRTSPRSRRRWNLDICWRMILALSLVFAALTMFAGDTIIGRRTPTSRRAVASAPDISSPLGPYTYSAGRDRDDAEIIPSSSQAAGATLRLDHDAGQNVDRGGGGIRHETLATTTTTASAPPPDSYPLLETAPDPLDGVPGEVQKAWGVDCKNTWKCGRWRCATHQTELHAALGEAMAEWVRICSLLGVVTVNAYGSLVASRYRNTTMMRWDRDVDAIIWAHDTAKFEDFAPGYNLHHSVTGSGFSLSVQPDWRRKLVLPDGGGRRYFRDQGVDFINPNVRLRHRSGRQNVFVDGYYMYADDHGAEEGAAHMDDFTVVRMFGSTTSEYVDIPRDWMFPLQPCYLEGVRTQCPSMGGRVLQKIYGADVRVPDHHLDLATGCWEKGAPK